MRRPAALALTAVLMAGFAGAALLGFPARAEPQDKPAAAPPAQPADPAKQPLDEATRKALEEAMHKTGAIPVPSDLPVIKKTELADGLVVEDLKIGDGYEVKPGGAIVMHYHGTLKADGHKFDSTYERGTPVAYPLTQLIPGWQKGVPGMKIGGIRRLFVPAALGYGSAGQGADIPPNADLVFIIQIVDALKVEDVKVGTGEEVGAVPVCATAYSMKTADGKEVASAPRDKPYLWIPRENMGIAFTLEGMKVGGVRKATIPAMMNKGDPRLAGGRPLDVALTVEFELISVRNLPTE